MTSNDYACEYIKEKLIEQDAEKQELYTMSTACNVASFAHIVIACGFAMMFDSEEWIGFLLIMIAMIGLEFAWKIVANMCDDEADKLCGRTRKG